LTERPGDATYGYVGAFVDELARSGIRHVAIAPGSRSTPIALSLANHPAIKLWMHVDERCAAFFALGLARGLGEPVALLCTSGTAAANFYPAIIEAKSESVPLLVLTADRPPELRDVGAAQTIDQNRLYGSYPKWFVEVALPGDSPDLIRYARTLAGRAVATAKESPAGPVHLNFPLREPLIPESGLPFGASAQPREDQAPWVRVSDAVRALDDEDASRIAGRLSSAQRPIIVCGPQYDRSLPPALSDLAVKLGAPILADPLSQLRWGRHDRGCIIDRYDAMLRDSRFADSVDADLILRIGGPPTSKTTLQFMARSSAVQMVIDEAKWPDPTLMADEIIHANPRVACGQLIPRVSARSSDANWLNRWKSANKTASDALEQYTCSLSESFEGRALADVMSVVPEGGTVFVSSSMPVRDLDAFGGSSQKSIAAISNRGANGIDGVVSTALGVAAVADGPLVLVIGDLAFYHDMNGLLAAKLHELNATIVLLNNDGGGIFSFLPQAVHREHFEQLFGTPHGLDFAPAASMYGASYARATDSSSLQRALSYAIGGKGLHIIEMRTDRERNVTLHREAWAAVATALDII
jgi:2-succinyl-5-enolpyruvyl-6-hydroxy-3-cyclohexene-1-carboxylate synthase